jgi:hypothetical protein
VNPLVDVPAVRLGREAVAQSCLTGVAGGQSQTVTRSCMFQDRGGLQEARLGDRRQHVHRLISPQALSRAAPSA